MKQKTYYFYCPDCKEAWTDEWNCPVDTRCDKCDAYYSPFDTKKEWIDAQTPNSIKFMKSYRKRML